MTIGTLAAGARVGNFVIERVLGAGSFGITYMASHATLKGQWKVAIKEFFPREYAERQVNGTIIPRTSASDRSTFEWALERFSDEAQTLTRFTHPNIVRVTDFVSNEHNTAYIVMEYVEGETIEDWVESLVAQGQLPGKAETLAIFRQLLDGCAAVHRQGLLHRDIKPNNIMLRADQSGRDAAEGAQRTPVLIDFGSSRDLALQQGGYSALVAEGYSPPEQYSRNSMQGEYSDVYALACTFYYILSGQAPPHASARLAEQVEPIAPERVALFGQKLVRAVYKGMELQVGARPASIAAWRDLLDIDSPVEPAKGLDRRALLAGGAGLAAVAVGGAIWKMQSGSSLSRFQRPLTPVWQHEFGAFHAEPLLQIHPLDDGRAIVATSWLRDDEVPRMRAIKVAADGTLGSDWIDAASPGWASSILPAPDGGAYVAGGVGGKAVVVRLSGDWRELWRKEFADGSFSAILPAESGIIMGTEGKDFSGAELVAADLSGNLQWRKGIDKAKAESIQRMIRLADGSYAALGWGVEQKITPSGPVPENSVFVALLDREGDSKSRLQMKGLGLSQGWAITEADGVIYVTGWTSEGRPNSPSRMFVWAIDRSGTTLWQRWDYPETPSSGRSLMAGPNGALYLAGWSANPPRMRLSQIGPGGDMVWDKVLPATRSSSAVFDLAAVPGGGAMAAGIAQTSGALPQLMVAKFDTISPLSALF